MTINDKIRYEKMQYNVNKEAFLAFLLAFLALSSGKIDKYEHLTGKEILLTDQSRIIEQARFSYSPLGKTLEKQKIPLKTEE